MTQKKLHRFFVPDIPPSGIFEINDSHLVHQLLTVLKYRTNEKFIIFSEGSDDVVVLILQMTKHAVRVEQQERLPAIHRPNIALIAAVSIIKQDLFELVVQKLTELGVTIIVPIIASRTVKQSLRHDRLKTISREAIEQCGRNTVVDIHEPLLLSDCFHAFPFPSIIFDPRAEELANKTYGEKTLVMYIGPEGGWSDEDQREFKKHATMLRKLGYTMLRTETAAIVGAYVLLNTI